MFKVNKGSGKRPYGYAGKCISWYTALLNTNHGAGDGHVERAISHSSEKFVFFIILMYPKEDWFFSAWLSTLEFLSLHVPLTFQLCFLTAQRLRVLHLEPLHVRLPFWVLFFFSPQCLENPLPYTPLMYLFIFSQSHLSLAPAVWGSDVVPQVQLTAPCCPPGLSSWTLQWAPVLTSSVNF